MHEFDLIKNYFSKLTKNNKSALNLNDDVFFDKKKQLVVSVDTYNEGIHFPDFDNPYLVIKKILRASISDLICKGVKPKYYFITGSGNKKTFSIRKLKNLTRSLLEEQKNIILNFAVVIQLFQKNLVFQ
jgi:thiamine-monophosphate kinase